jgi:hypothetical protein
LPDNVILDPTEMAMIRDRVATNNLAIADICATAQIPVLDANAILREITNEGRDLGGVTLGGAFLTGGLFSFDGVHLTELGYAILANEWIALINKRGSQLPPVNLGPYFGLASSGGGEGGVRATAGRRVVASGSAAAVPPFEFSEEAFQNLRALFPRLDRR